MSETKQPRKGERPRVLIVCDGAAWFIRRVAVTEEDWTHDQMVYRCDEHLGGPYKSAASAVWHLPKRAR